MSVPSSPPAATRPAPPDRRRGGGRAAQLVAQLAADERRVLDDEPLGVAGDRMDQARHLVQLVARRVSRHDLIPRRPARPRCRAPPARRGGPESQRPPRVARSARPAQRDFFASEDFAFGPDAWTFFAPADRRGLRLRARRLDLLRRRPARTSPSARRLDLLRRADRRGLSPLACGAEDDDPALARPAFRVNVGLGIASPLRPRSPEHPPR